MAYLSKFLYSSWIVLGQMAPYLLFGFLAAGILSVFVSPEWVERHLGGRGFSPVWKSALVGVPLPLCSCGVIPFAASIRRHGASKGATTAFLLSTPQTGVDSIFATYAMLGPVYAVYRPLAALLTGILGGALVSAFEDGKSGEGGPGTSGNSRCTDGYEWEDKTGSAIGRALRYGFVTLPRDIAKPLLVGIAIAGLVSGLIEKDALASYLGGGFVSMLVMMAFGIPLYVCSTASIPIAVGFMHLGASPGAALVFLITGPATNAATLSVVWNLLGRRTVAIYLLTVALGSLAAGYSLDLIYQLTQTGYVMTEHVHTEGGSWVEAVSAAGLLGVLVGNLIPRKSDPRGEAKTGVEQLTLNVIGMRCSHCADTIARTLKEAPGVLDARVDLRKGKAVISGKDLNRETLIAGIRDLGYEASLWEE